MRQVAAGRHARRYIARMRFHPAGLAIVAAAAICTSAPRAAAQTARSAPHDGGWWRAFVAGFATSLALHEAGHITASFALGSHPTFGFDKGRPTVYSGIDSRLEPRKQFVFSSAGLTAQSLLDEGILDVPHERGSAFERGVLASGIGTALFYATIGRSGSVSDVDFMARTSSLSKNDLTLILGGIALLHAVRVGHDGHYAHFFLRPASSGGLRLGVWTE